VVFAIPTFESMFVAFGADLPGPTRLVVWISNLFGKGWYIVVPVIAFAVWWVRRNDLIALWLDGRLGGVTARAPIMGAYLTRAFTSRLSTLLAATIAGAPLRESLAHLRATLRHAGSAQRVAQLEERVASGLALPEAVAATPSLPSRLRVAVELGSRTQRLETALRHAVAVSDDEMGRSLLRLEQALLVMGYVFVGVLVGFLVIALYLPIFKMGSAI
jgi:type IV pilus assembly protein PilC